MLLFDDFVPEWHQRCIEGEVANMHWQWNDDIADARNKEIVTIGRSLSHDQGGLGGNVLSLDSAPNNDVLIGLMLPLVAQAADIIEKPLELTRIRAGMFTRGSGGVHTPHVDFFEPHYTLLYYVNDSDGDTILWEQWYQGQQPKVFVEEQAISPRRGRAIIFNGLQYHSSSVPVNHSTRLAININLMIKESDGTPPS